MKLMMDFRGTRNQIRKTFAATLFSIKYLVEHFARMSISRSLLTVSSYFGYIYRVISLSPTIIAPITHVQTTVLCTTV